MNNTPAIELRDVDFSYDSEPVLENVNITINQKEFVSIVGPNGGGKTTLLYLILGLMNPDRGEVRVLGKKPEDARTKIGYMPQSLDFDRQFPVTVMDVVLMGRLNSRLGGPYSKEDKNEAMRALQEIGIEDLAKRPFSKLSGGQRQRVLIARTLTCEPEVLLLDEPTANVDPHTESMMHEFLDQMQNRVTMVLVSHDLGFVSRAVKSVICVNRRVVRHPTAEITPEAIKELYKGEMRIVRHDQRYQNGKNSDG
ncbi:MAG: ABC transporter ATP-binding protein [candidate division Zixibacteria bacterium]|nr:ABC transporter ATP-binding protein [candidate division Zixibacteria bacterium]NIT54185.1 ABC transporter ATP-binding protein [candidate division Zixibacteria bacterium]NIW42690.1 ATP-binding cassette domain-containing protein [candidate division Zixibacteria bacterium]NIX57051.1 ATP-binding cassette domain-containing protein [candidate division Zixibacteria bacterium]